MFIIHSTRLIEGAKRGWQVSPCIFPRWDAREFKSRQSRESSVYIFITQRGYAWSKLYIHYYIPIWHVLQGTSATLSSVWNWELCVVVYKGWKGTFTWNWPQFESLIFAQIATISTSRYDFDFFRRISIYRISILRYAYEVRREYAGFLT